jgi:hypothetical protein
MGYWMRFFDTKKPALTLRSLTSGLRRIDPRFGFALGQLTYDGADFAQLDVSKPGDGLFDEELATFRACVEAKGGRKSAAAKAEVLATLDATRRTVAVRVGDHPEALDLLDTVWAWLFEHRAGLLQADGEGFYDGEELILAVK